MDRHEDSLMVRLKKKPDEQKERQTGGPTDEQADVHAEGQTGRQTA